MTSAVPGSTCPGASHGSPTGAATVAEEYRPILSLLRPLETTNCTRKLDRIMALLESLASAPQVLIPGPIHELLGI